MAAEGAESVYRSFLKYLAGLSSADNTLEEAADSVATMIIIFGAQVRFKLAVGWDGIIIRRGDVLTRPLTHSLTHSHLQSCLSQSLHPTRKDAYICWCVW